MQNQAESATIAGLIQRSIGADRIPAQLFISGTKLRQRTHCETIRGDYFFFRLNFWARMPAISETKTFPSRSTSMPCGS